MKRHITNHILTAYIAGIFEGSDRRIAAHLLECGACRKRHDSMIMWMTPRFRNAPKPTVELKNRVLGIYRQIANEPAQVRSRRLTWRNAVPIAGAAAAAIVIALFFMFRDVKPGIQRISLIASGVTGEVIANGSRVFPGMSIHDGSTIIVSTDRSGLVLARDESISIRIFPKSRFTINRAYAQKDISAATLHCTLHQGRLLSKIDGARGITYEYVTPQALIRSRGTEFYLTVSEKETTVLMVSGNVWITSFATKEKVKTIPGSIYTVKNKITGRKMLHNDYRILKHNDKTAEERMQPSNGVQKNIKSPKKTKQTDDDSTNNSSGKKQSRTNDEGASKLKKISETPSEKRDRLKREETRREDLQEMRDLRNMRREKR